MVCKVVSILTHLHKIPLMKHGLLHRRLGQRNYEYWLPGTVCGLNRYFRTNNPMEGRSMGRTNLSKNGFSEALSSVKGC